MKSRKSYGATAPQKVKEQISCFEVLDEIKDLTKWTKAIRLEVISNLR